MFAVLLVSGLGAAEFGSATVAEVRTIYDGDTFRVNIAGWPSVVGESMPVRIKGVDTPELRGKCQSEKDAARAAKQLRCLILAAKRSSGAECQYVLLKLALR